MAYVPEHLLTDVVAASLWVRQDLRAVVRQHLDDGVEMVELDYQPA